MRTARAVLGSKGAWLVVGAVVVGILSQDLPASPVGLPMTPSDFNNLLGGNANAIGTVTATVMDHQNMLSVVYSQAFTDNAGNYLYLYQVENTGTPTNNVVEVFTCSPFAGLAASTTVGYLTANAPAGFTVGNQVPAGASVDAVAGPTLSFGFPSWTFPSYAVDPGEKSYTLYVLSDKTDGTIMGNVIDGTIGSGPVVGPVPEPATLSLLFLGAGLLLVRRARR